MSGARGEAAHGRVPAGGEDAGGGASEERRKNSSRDTCGVRKEVHVAWPARNLICAPAGEGLHHEEQDHGKHDEQNLLRRHGSPAPPQGAGSGNAAMLLSCHVHLVNSCAAAGHARPAAWPPRRAGSPWCAPRRGSTGGPGRSHGERSRSQAAVLVQWQLPRVVKRRLQLQRVVKMGRFTKKKN